MKSYFVKIASKLALEKLNILASVNPKPNATHPPLSNRRCHLNTAWHLANTPGVIAVAQGFYIESGEAIAHFVCLDVSGNYFDPTIPAEYMDNQKFYITRIHTSTETHNSGNASDNLVYVKDQLWNLLPYKSNKIYKNNSF